MFQNKDRANTQNFVKDLIASLWETAVAMTKASIYIFSFPVRS